MPAPVSQGCGLVHGIMGSRHALLGMRPAAPIPLPPPARPCPQMVDVGCGIGGSSRHIARKFGCEARGITLSPVQAQRANQITAQQGLGDRVSFQVAGGCCCCACRRLPPLPRWQAGGLGSTDVHAAG